MSAYFFNPEDSCEIVEMWDAEKEIPIFTFFLVNRKIAYIFAHSLDYNKETKFKGYYTSLANHMVAAGYFMANKSHGKQVDPKTFPIEFRMAVLGLLPKPKPEPKRESEAELFDEVLQH
jgi:hypothetical protein